MLSLVTQLTLLLAASSFWKTAGTQPSVYYFESLTNYFMAPNLAFSRNEASVILKQNMNNCSCRTACFTSGCQAWTVVRGANGNIECRLSNAGPTSLRLIENPNATYFFLRDSVNGTYSIQKDKLHYVELNTRMNYSTGKDTCQRIPGHRLLIIKTLVQYDYFKSLWNSAGFVVVDLRKISTGQSGVYDHVWGDGTPYNETQLDERLIVDDAPASVDVYINYQKKFNDHYKSAPYRIICQANPLGVDW